MSGSKNLLIVLINFADRALQTTPTSWYTPVFDETKKSVAKYYRDNSFGLLSISPVAHTQPNSPPGVISVTISDNHPNNSSNMDIGIDYAISNHALIEALRYVNFANFDLDNDGLLDPDEISVYFIYAGYDTGDSNRSPSIRGHSSSGGLTAGMKFITNWAQSGELNDASAQQGMGVIAHELGHSILGLPDLYDSSLNNRGMGLFSLMGVGTWGHDIGEVSGTTPTVLDIWSREYLGWSTPIAPHSQTLLSLAHPLSSQNAAYKLIDSIH